MNEKTAFEIKPVEQERLNELLALRWPNQSMIIAGQFVRPEDVEGIGAFADDRMHGMATWRRSGRIMHIIAVNAFTEVRGVGVALVDAMIAHARELGVVLLRATISNDNVIALRFYQRRGFRMTGLHRGMFDVMRLANPAIPLKGLDGIPMRDEIELEYEL